MEHEIQPEIQGSQHPEPSAKGKRDPRIFFGVNALLSFWILLQSYAGHNEIVLTIFELLAKVECYENS